MAWTEIPGETRKRALALRPGVCVVHKNKASLILHINKKEAKARGINGLPYYKLYVDEEHKKIGIQLLEGKPQNGGFWRAARGGQLKFSITPAGRKLGLKPGYYRWSLDETGLLVVDASQCLSPGEALQSRGRGP